MRTTDFGVGDQADLDKARPACGVTSFWSRAVAISYRTLAFGQSSVGGITVSCRRRRLIVDRDTPRRSAMQRARVDDDKARFPTPALQRTGRYAKHQCRLPGEADIMTRCLGSWRGFRPIRPGSIHLCALLCDLSSRAPVNDQNRRRRHHRPSGTALELTHPLSVLRCRRLVASAHIVRGKRRTRLPSQER